MRHSFTKGARKTLQLSGLAMLLLGLHSAPLLAKGGEHDHSDHEMHQGHEGHEGHDMHKGHEGHDMHEGHEGHEGHQGHGDHQSDGGADPHAAHKAMLNKKASKASSIKLNLSDAELLNRDGETVRLKTDVMAERIVVVDFVYTTCTTVCPVLSVILRKVQDSMADRMGKEVVMVSISVDPTRDTPAKLKDYAAKHSAGDNWYWLTGNKFKVDEVLLQMGAYTPSYEDHPAMVLVGDMKTGEWSRFYGFPDPKDIVAKIDHYSAARSTAVAGQ